jgi:1,4-dihydroxy-2-naphthoate octaprenyltransferase
VCGPQHALDTPVRARRLNVADQPASRNRIALATGIVLVVVSVILMLDSLLADNNFPLFLGLVGIVVIAASRKSQSND